MIDRSAVLASSLCHESAVSPSPQRPPAPKLHCFKPTVVILRSCSAPPPWPTSSLLSTSSASRLVVFSFSREPPLADHHVCLGSESRAPTSSSSSQAWLVVVVQFVFQPAAPNSSSATPVIISVMAELQIEKLNSSSNGYLVQFAYSVVLSAISIVGISRGNRRNHRDGNEEERQW
ncbi:hypothetical protein IGI04_009977 [Brassica rapa subsp. trilocularis]|uniref:Uncharacterized protein n=1 Tax=Brassica rapa subsp. trilocularis TaxID=1813537 RepID=A0ABQ7MZU6_BRACM|nr:hypothetical protein IGI04_009977 [Brassica rapa subsp. trilocularis]